MNLGDAAPNAVSALSEEFRFSVSLQRSGDELKPLQLPVDSERDFV